MKKTEIKAIVTATVMAFMAACTPDVAETPTCSSTLHGYSATYPMPAGTSHYNVVPCNYGIINTTTAGISTVAGFTGTGQFRQNGVYNPDDGCYYVLGNTGVGTPYFVGGTPGFAIFKMSSSGAVTSYGKDAGDSCYYFSLSYDEMHHKFFAVRVSAVQNELCELTLSSSTFTSSPVLSAGSVISALHLTIDQNTGDKYYTGVNASTHSTTLYKLPWGGSATLVSTAPANVYVFAINYNTNDDNIYGIRTNDSVNFKLARIDLSTGTHTELGSIIPGFDGRVYAIALDRCSDRIYVSAGNSVAQLMQYDIATGALLRNDTVSAIYQGLNVQY
jgi:hypothetical protein